jgi:hypothetical protein
MSHGGNDPMDVALRALGEALQAADGPPPEALRQAKAIFTWRTIDAELAELTFDSLVHGELAGVRSGATGAARTLTFETQAVVVDAEVTAAGDAFDLVGSLSPADGAALSVERPGAAEVPVDVDSLGRFQLRGLADGTLRFVVRAGDGTRVVTDWFGL